MQSVLVVEDESDIREMIRYNLSKAGYQVAGVASGEMALAVADLQPFDVVLLDRMLPGMDGLEVCRELRSNPRTQAVPIIMVTARGEDSDVVGGLRGGADDYITKPFSPKVLVARIEAALRRKERDD